jgi:ribonuclease P protein component
MKNINIIKNNYEFQTIIGKRNCLKTNQFFIYRTPSDDHFHYGISVGKKLGNAVARNKIKRQVRAMVREILPDVKNIKQKIVIIVRNTYFNFDYRCGVREGPSSRDRATRPSPS